MIDNNAVMPGELYGDLQQHVIGGWERWWFALTAFAGLNWAAACLT